MKFTIHELRLILEDKRAQAMSTKLRVEPGIHCKYVTKYVPCKPRLGGPTTMIQSMNQYDTEQVIEHYEAKLQNPTHWHTAAHIKRVLSVMYAIEKL